MLDVAAISRELARFTPSMAGVTPSRWRNIRALFGAALKLTGVKLQRRRRYVDALPQDWKALLSQLPDKFHRTRLARFASFCAAAGIGPGRVDDRVADHFHQALRQNSLVERPAAIQRDAILAWNVGADMVPGWPGGLLGVPNRVRHFALPVTDFPPSFGVDLAAYLAHIAGDDPFSEVARRPCAPITIKDVRQRILQMVSALVLSGACSPEAIASLAELTAPAAAKAALAYLFERNGRRKTGQLEHHVTLLIKLAKHWTKLPAPEIEQLRVLRKRLDPGQTGMTARNKAVLRQFDDPENVRRLLSLPAEVLRALPASGPLSHQQALALQSALAVAILSVAPMRIKNLAGLTLDRHLVPIRAGIVSHLIIPAHEVKNDAPLEFTLPVHVLRLLETYMQRARPVLAEQPSVHVFPAPKGGAKLPGQFGVQVKLFIWRQTGLTMNVHAFRHLAAMLFLRAHPGEYQTVRLLLGHKSLETTMRAYVGFEQKDAVERYDTLIETFLKAGSPPMRGMRLCLRVADWPEGDRRLWQEGLRPRALFDDATAGTDWAPLSRDKVAKGYGRWLRFLIDAGRLDPTTPPGLRVTRDNVAAYLDQLRAEVAPYTVMSRLQDLHNAMRILAPGQDFGWLLKFWQSMRARAVPSSKPSWQPSRRCRRSLHPRRRRCTPAWRKSTAPRSTACRKPS